MIPELDCYHGAVLRQLLIAAKTPVTIGVANLSGRKDVFVANGVAFQLKYSTKRLSPWQFTYLGEHFAELQLLADRYRSAWAVLVCGRDGVVALRSNDLLEVVQLGPSGVGSLTARRSRNGMYRVSGGGGQFARAIPRGVQGLLDAISEDDLRCALV